MYYYPIKGKRDDRFLRNFGVSLQRRDISGLPIETRSYVKANRAIRYHNLNRTKIRTSDNVEIYPRKGHKLFFPDIVVSHFDIGLEFAHTKASDGSMINLDNFPKTFDAILQIPVAIPRGEGLVTATLNNAGAQLSSLYLSATTKPSFEPTLNLISGTPLIILEYSVEEITGIPSWFKDISNEHDISLHYSSVYIKHKNYNVWIIQKEHEKKDVIRKIRICLSHLHHEKEGILRVIEKIKHTQDIDTLYYEELKRFLQTYLTRIQKMKKYGHDKQNLLESAYAYDFQASREEIQYVLNELNIKLEVINNHILDKKLKGDGNVIVINGDISGGVIQVGPNGKVNYTGGDVIGSAIVAFSNDVDITIGNTAKEELKESLDTLKTEVVKIVAEIGKNSDQIDIIMNDIKEFCAEAGRKEPRKEKCQFLATSVKEILSKVAIPTAVTVIGSALDKVLSLLKII